LPSQALSLLHHSANASSNYTSRTTLLVWLSAVFNQAWKKRKKVQVADLVGRRTKKNPRWLLHHKRRS
jgi:hypothetical protein